MSTQPSGFDPNLFLDAQVAEVNIKRPPLPVHNPAAEDGLYTALIGEVKMDSGIVSKEGERKGSVWLSAIIPLQIEVPQQVQDQLGLKLDKGTITPNRPGDDRPDPAKHHRQFSGKEPAAKAVSRCPGPEQAG